jgi:restriction system protein
MPIPSFQELFSPILDLAADRKEHTLEEVEELLAAQLGLTPEEREELLPSGQSTRLHNRAGWARTHLGKAGLLERTGWGRFRITERGLQLLAEKPGRIDLRTLDRYPEHVAFRTGSRKEEGVQPPSPDGVASPFELLDSSYQALRRALALELLEKVKSCSPNFFESLVVDLLVAMGYGGSRRDAGKAVGRSGDGGIDGIIKEDKLGLDAVFLQAKRWENVVGRPVVQAFAGSLEGHRARKGVLITTSKFTADALDYVNRIEKKIVLIDGEQLAEHMIEHNIGVTEQGTYVVKRLDQDYFEEE